MYERDYAGDRYTPTDLNDPPEFPEPGPPKPEHKTSVGYGPHDWDCPACVADAAERVEYRRTHNPHRTGTKAHERWDRDRARVDWAMDMRGETYWSM